MVLSRKERKATAAMAKKKLYVELFQTLENEMDGVDSTINGLRTWRYIIGQKIKAKPQEASMVRETVDKIIADINKEAKCHAT